MIVKWLIGCYNIDVVQKDDKKAEALAIMMWI